MQIVGTILFIILILWLFLHKRKNQSKYVDGLALGASILPKLTEHYLI